MRSYALRSLRWNDCEAVIFGSPFVGFLSIAKLWSTPAFISYYFTSLHPTSLHFILLHFISFHFTYKEDRAQTRPIGMGRNVAAKTSRASHRDILYIH